MRYLILSVEYNAEAMADVECPNCGHDEIGQSGACLVSYWTEPPNVHLETCDCGLGDTEHVVAKSTDEPIESIVSLKWIAPTLADAEGLTLTEDDASEYADEGIAQWARKWSGEVTEDQWQALKREWGIELSDSEPNLGMLTELGFIPSLRFNFDGMDWNTGGWTPIAFADLSVEPTEDEAREIGFRHFGLVEREAE